MQGQTCYPAYWLTFMTTEVNLVTVSNYFWPLKSQNVSCIQVNVLQLTGTVAFKGNDACKTGL